VGASEAIDLTVRAILNPGDEVIVPAPSYVSYAPCVALAGGVPVSVETKVEDNFILTPEELDKVITKKTKAIILPYPNNPTGAIMKKNDLAKLANYLEDKDIVIISDEIYSELTYGSRHVSIASFRSVKDKVVLINGFSKAFAMTGWRIGFIAANEEIMAAVTKIHQYTMLCASTISQMAALEALKLNGGNGYQTIEQMTAQYDLRRKKLFKAFNEMGLTCFEPKGAFYLFPSIKSTGLSSEEFCTKLLYEQGVAIVPGTAFGESGEGFVRCSYAASMKNIEKAIAKIDKFVKGL
ncbi:MAG: aminotransferase class I/II-fold pyridoxal phosphate-dependent enzyme, partial [Clostridia bacterium]|nr:aminotransferase class I/II-fold pyridoxal phosphate-dependent enzyme [Clostridia bacterium]